MNPIIRSLNSLSLATALLLCTATSALAGEHQFSGRVVEIASGAGIAGADIKLQVPGNWGLRPTVASTTSDANGGFALSTTSSSTTFWLRVERSGYVTITGLSLDGLDPMDLLVPMDRPGSITVRVVDAVTGVGLANERVQIANGTAETTGADGRARFDGLLPGEYPACKVTFSGTRYANVCLEGHPLGFRTGYEGPTVTLASGASLEVDLPVPLGSRVSGEVRSAIDGRLLPDARIKFEFLDANGSRHGTHTVDTDESGRYAIEGLPAGAYLVAADRYLGVGDMFMFGRLLFPGVPCAPDCDPAQGELLQFTAGSVRDDIDFSITPTARISGVVRDATDLSPIADATIRLTYRAPLGNPLELRELRTDAEGAFLIDFIGASYDYWLESSDTPGYFGVFWPDHDDPTASPWDLEPFVLAEGEHMSDADFLLQSGPSIRARVLERYTGEPLQEALVMVSDDTGASGGWGGWTDADGRFQTTAMPSGSYVVAARDSYLRPDNRWFRDCRTWMERSCTTDRKPDPQAGAVIVFGEEPSVFDVEILLAPFGTFGSGFEE